MIDGKLYDKNTHYANATLCKNFKDIGEKSFIFTIEIFSRVMVGSMSMSCQNFKAFDCDVCSDRPANFFD